ncbi:MAG: D-alanyl-D-alanine carboxypeptidase [Clostridium sp.]|nr:D-alanyl-D-alanine carboxypeptidase [Clostridium sp.]
MRKRFLVIFTLAVYIAVSIGNSAYASEINVDARSAIAMDSETRRVLFEKNANTIMPMASTTKIMTALVAIKYGNLDKKVTISKKSASIRGSTVGYKEGEKITIRELLYGLLFRSGNDAAIAIAESIGKDVKGFAKIMNEYAFEIGAENSHFESPHGLDSENHYCTAYDLALITSVAKDNSVFNEIVSTKDVDGAKMGFTRSYRNINKILYRIKGANGVKTGYTGKAGKCLVSSVNIEGHDVIFVVLNCTPRWKETEKLYNYVVKNYSYKKVCNKNNIVNKVYGKNKVVLSLNKDIVIPVKNEEKCSTKIILPSKVDFKIKNGMYIGKMQFYSGSKRICSYPLKVETQSKEQ